MNFLSRYMWLLAYRRVNMYSNVISVSLLHVVGICIYNCIHILLQCLCQNAEAMFIVSCLVFLLLIIYRGLVMAFRPNEFSMKWKANHLCTKCLKSVEASKSKHKMSTLYIDTIYGTSRVMSEFIFIFVTVLETKKLVWCGGGGSLFFACLICWLTIWVCHDVVNILLLAFASEHNTRI